MADIPAGTVHTEACQATGQEDATLRLDSTDWEIAESLGLHTVEELVEAASNLEEYLRVLADVQAVMPQLEEYTEGRQEPSLN